MVGLAMENKAWSEISGLEGNILACLSLWSEIPAVKVEDNGGIMKMASGIPMPAMNMAVSRGPIRGNLEERIEEVSRFFSSHNLPCLWWDLPSGHSVMLDACLQAQGFTFYEHAPGMAADLTPYSDIAPLPTGLDILRADDERSIRQWADVSHRGYEMPDVIKGMYTDFVLHFRTMPSLEMYLCQCEGKPVATGMLVLAAGVAGIYWIATVPEARRRGAGSAVTRHLLERARALGYCTAVLEASDMGRPIYEKLGFTECCQVGMYVKE